MVMKEESKVRVCLHTATYHANFQLLIIIDGDTIFFFNYRSDRMREIAAVFGVEDKPMEVDVPKDLV